MTESDLKARLMRDARANGICAQGYKEMCEYDRDKLIAYYLRTIDWSLEKGYPSLVVLREEFSNIEDKGVYIDKTFAGETFAEKQEYVLHNCKGVINVAMDYENAIIPMFYFANGCDIEIRCEQKNVSPIRVPLYVFGDNVVRAESNENCVFKIYKQEVEKK